MRKLLNTVLVGLLLCAIGCATTSVPNIDLIDQRAVLNSKPVKNDYLRDCIIYGGQGKGWEMKDVSPGNCTGVYIQKKYVLKVDVRYGNGLYSIQYKDSEKLGNKDEKVVPGAGRWVSALKDGIDYHIENRQRFPKSRKPGSRDYLADLQKVYSTIGRTFRNTEDGRPHILYLHHDRGITKGMAKERIDQLNQLGEWAERDQHGILKKYGFRVMRVEDVSSVPEVPGVYILKTKLSYYSLGDKAMRSVATKAIGGVVGMAMAKKAQRALGVDFDITVLDHKNKPVVRTRIVRARGGKEWNHTTRSVNIKTRQYLDILFPVSFEYADVPGYYRY